VLKSDDDKVPVFESFFKNIGEARRFLEIRGSYSWRIFCECFSGADCVLQEQQNLLMCYCKGFERVLVAADAECSTIEVWVKFWTSVFQAADAAVESAGKDGKGGEAAAVKGAIEHVVAQVHSMQAPVCTAASTGNR
jgi:hypothetical protein